MGKKKSRGYLPNGAPGPCFRLWESELLIYFCSFVHVFFFRLFLVLCCECVFFLLITYRILVSLKTINMFDRVTFDHSLIILYDNSFSPLIYFTLFFFLFLSPTLNLSTFVSNLFSLYPCLPFTFLSPISLFSCLSDTSFYVSNIITCVLTKVTELTL